MFMNKELFENRQIKFYLKTKLKKDIVKKVGEYNEILNKYSNVKILS